MKKLFIAVLPLVATITCPMDSNIVARKATDRLIQEVLKVEPNLDVVNLLLDLGADVNARAEPDKTLLLHACASNALPLIRLLVERGADCTARDKMRYTPLILLTTWSEPCRGNLEFLKTVRLLIQSGDIDPHAISQFGERASDYADGAVAALLRDAMCQ